MAHSTINTLARLPLWKKLLFASLPALVVLAAIEVACRATERHDPPQLVRRWRFLQRFHPFMGIYRRPSGRKVLDDAYGRRTFTTNKLGLRGDDIVEWKTPGVYRICCLGGSTTENEFVDDRDTYCAKLQCLLRERTGRARLEVVNAGCATYSTAHSFINYALRICDLKPDLVTIYHGINDLVPGMCPEFRPDYSHFYGFYHKVGALETDLELTVRTPFDPLLDWSAAYRLCQRRLAQRERSRFREPAYFATRPASRVSGPGPAAFERNVRATIRLARADGAKVLLCTFPYSLRHDMPRRDRNRWGQFGWSKFLTIDGVIDGLQRHNVILTQVARQEHTLLCDLERVVPKDTEHFFDSCHLTPKGQEVAAQALAKTILAAGLVPQPGPR